MVKNLSANASDTGEVGPTPGLGRSPREGSGNAFQYSHLGNPTEKPGRLQAMGSEKSRTWRNDWTPHTHTHTHMHKISQSEVQNLYNMKILFISSYRCPENRKTWHKGFFLAEPENLYILSFRIYVFIFLNLPTSFYCKLFISQIFKVRYNNYFAEEISSP